MKKLSKFSTFLAIFAFGAVSAFALTPVYEYFSDQDVFDDWYKNAAIDMKQDGIVTGYSDDNSFRPGNNVTRAEMVVMLDRLQEDLMDEIDDVQAGEGGVTESEVRDIANLSAEKMIEEAFEAYFSVEDDISDLAAFEKKAIVLAEMGIRFLDEDEVDEDDLEFIKSIDMPLGNYELWREPTGIVLPSYLHYTGDRIDGDVIMEVDQWFGPFY